MEQSTQMPDLLSNKEFYIGLSLALCSSLFIGTSFIVKKVSLQRLGKVGSVRAGQGGFGYLRDYVWWIGLLTMGFGEFLNFAAYAFAPASLITPLGALSVLTSALLAEHFLHEKLKLLGKFGCFLCIVGSTIMVLYAPKERQAESLEEFFINVQNPAFVHYLIVVLVISFMIVLFIGPRYGSRYVSVYITLCSLIGSLTVMACKGFGLAIKKHFSRQPQIPQTNSLSLTILLLFIVLLCIIVQMNYLNKALDLFSINLVTPIYYVMFTTLVIVASAILFKEWRTMGQFDVFGALLGFFVVVLGVVLLNNYKEGVPLSRIHSSSYGANIYV